MSCGVSVNTLIGMLCFVLIACVGGHSAVNSNAPIIPRYVGAAKMKHPAFVHVVDSRVFVTSFSGSPLASGSIWEIPLPTLLSQPESAVARRVSSGEKWPNEITAVPASVPLPGFVFGDGFLVPLKSTGSVSYFNTSSAGPGQAQAVQLVSPSQHGWWYHKAIWFDVNGDGRLDIVTARARKPLVGAGRGQLVWLEQPAHAAQFPWKLSVLASGPDVQIAGVSTTRTGRDTLLVYAAEFFGARLSAYLIGDGRLLNSTVIDDSLGMLYAVVPTRGLFSPGDDLSIVVTNYKHEGFGGAYMYTLSSRDDPMCSSCYQRRTLWDKFANVQRAVGSGAPGWVYPHLPSNHSTTANIWVCGDGAETLSLLSPDNSTGTGEQTNYTLAWTRQYHSTIGAMAVGDFDGDGYTDSMVTDYDNGLIHVFTYARASPSAGAPIAPNPSQLHLLQ